MIKTLPQPEAFVTKRYDQDMAEKPQWYPHHHKNIKFCASAFAGFYSLAKN